MATGMKLWLGAVVVGAAMVASSLLPPRSYQARRPQVLPAEAEQYALQEEMRRLHGIVQTTRWSDSLSALTLATAEDGLATGVFEAPGIRPEDVAAWRAETLAALAALEPRDPRMTVGLYFQPANHAAIPDTPIPAVGEWEQIYAGAVDGAPYCFVVQPVRFRFTRDRLRELDLGACRFFAKYGVPGPRVLEWLETGALGFGEWGVTPPPARIMYVDGQRIVDLAVSGWPFPADLRAFGFVRHPLNYTNLGVDIDRCAAGQTPACVEAVTQPQNIGSNGGSDARYVAANSPVSYIGSWNQQPPFGPLTRTILANVEADFGEAAFASFWTSTSAVPDAFQSSFDADLGIWVRDWVDERYGLYRAGPGMPASTLGFSLLALMVFSAGACLTHWRRTVA